jgi:RNA recognition motif-containing protein
MSVFKLHVVGLPKRFGDPDVWTFFGEFGAVGSVKLIRDLKGTSTGFAVVQMDADLDNDLIGTLNRVRIEGSSLVVWRTPH